MPRTALFVIDIQNELAGDPQTEIPGAARIRAVGEQILAASRSLADASSAEKPPALTVFVQHEEAPESGGTLVRDAEPWKLVFPPRDGAADEILVAKTTQNTFESNPHLADRLKDAGVDHIVVFGLQSEYCVVSTGKGALEAGFRVSLLQGAHSTYDGEGGKTAADIEREVEETLVSRGATLVPYEKAIAQWRTAGVIIALHIFFELSKEYRNEKPVNSALSLGCIERFDLYYSLSGLHDSIKDTLFLYNEAEFQSNITFRNHISKELYLYGTCVSRYKLKRIPPKRLTSLQYQPKPIMCFQIIKYACGHRGKEDVNCCRKPANMRSLFKRVHNLVHLRGMNRSVRCERSRSIYTFRNQECQVCLLDRIRRQATRAFIRMPTGGERVLPKGTPPAANNQQAVPLQPASPSPPLEETKMPPQPRRRLRPRPPAPSPVRKLRRIDGEENLRAQYMKRLASLDGRLDRNGG
ncbi:hypothetical protein PWT90_05163 [Aphanocladium album]|nr:hypothetical protein PWT90_05163 [Aphanocladium album]